MAESSRTNAYLDRDEIEDNFMSLENLSEVPSDSSSIQIIDDENARNLSDVSENYSPPLILPDSSKNPLKSKSSGNSPRLSPSPKFDENQVSIILDDSEVKDVTPRPFASTKLKENQVSIIQDDPRVEVVIVDDPDDDEFIDIEEEEKETENDEEINENNVQAETILERIVGLKEIFSDGVRNRADKIINTTVSTVGVAIKSTSTIFWYTSTVMIFGYLPIVLGTFFEETFMPS